MRLLTEDALLVCDHELGKVALDASQRWVTIEGRAVLVEPDPADRSIAGCPNVGATIKPCTRTRAVRSGYSSWVRIDGKRVCLDTVVGFTNGTPPGVEYHVKRAGQSLVEEAP